ncbi:3-phosphoshikimate 1-carboxyvinyltransferase [Methanofollis fontis]|uniref:3-phosphoshikimate 1-carboxyvinyltransferase n=1 Tax=Methanofollis fontis TaxID=2052832 RepID=A0A483CRA5_9EURY|nr:3-phosphoshikimate 1-carboxyvinyltransferase [Methanofollis fontis]TAJ45348.1 3-phosphoshikimate 1-carboxyvinyltransferase [Methanofollis fontis]
MEVRIERRQEVDLRFTAPPSKSVTHRALMIAALAEGESVIRRPLRAADTRLTAAALRSLGIDLVQEEESVRLQGCAGALPDTGGPVRLSLGNSGTTLRIMAGVSLLAPHPVCLTGDARMQQRPFGPLGDALVQAGGRVRYPVQEGYPPVEVQGPLRGGVVNLEGGMSSQFLSSLLIAGPYARRTLAVCMRTPPVSRPYIDLTLRTMEDFGVRPFRVGSEWFVVPEGVYRGRDYTVEGDWSSASYLCAIAAVCGGRVSVGGLERTSAQGDRIFPEILSAMGCRVRWNGDLLTVERDGPLEGIEVGMASAPDIVQTVAAVAAFARGSTTITGVAHLRYKESDRLEAIRRVLTAAGAGVTVEGDRLTIRPGPLRPLIVDPENDHRTAMSAAVIGLGAGGVVVRDAGCVEKSYPGFWEALVGVGLL